MATKITDKILGNSGKVKRMVTKILPGSGSGHRGPRRVALALVHDKKLLRTIPMVCKPFRL